MLLMGNFVIDALCTILIGICDNVVYNLVCISYDIFAALCTVNIFGGKEGTPGYEIYEGFSKRIYSVIAIVMVFIFAYRLLLYILDPDGKYMNGAPGGGKASDLIKRIVLSVVLTVLAPLIFRYMYAFQVHVIDSDTIPKIVLGVGGAEDRFIKRGKQLSMITLMAFYHPNGMEYGDFVRPIDSKSYTNRADYCKAAILHGNEAKEYCQTNGFDGDPGLCEKWGKYMQYWCTKWDDYAISPILRNGDFHESINDNKEDLWDVEADDGHGIEYTWIVCTLAGVVIIYFIVCYAIAVGARAVKLGVLELIAPIPLLLRMFSKEKYYDPWFKEIKKTYLELFLRVAVIFFAVYLCTMVPALLGTLIDGIFSIK